ncbi:MAG: hypothetical protein ACI83P_002835 [Janthinobacterium sp.]|jgi:hypothetical protein
MVVRPVAVSRRQIRRYRVSLTGCVAFQGAARADALIGLDMRAGRYLLQKNLDRFAAVRAFEGKCAGGLGHRDFLDLLLLTVPSRANEDRGRILSPRQNFIRGTLAPLAP